MKNILLLAAVLSSAFVYSQYDGKVGINTKNPTETLEVKGPNNTNGIAHAGQLYLRTPGEPLEVPIYFMATSNANSTDPVNGPKSKLLTVFNHETATASLVNLLDLYFKNVSNRGVVSYDTKINATNYIAAVRSFSLEIYDNSNPTNPNLNVYTRHDVAPETVNNNLNYYQGSPRFYAYIQNGTWWIKADYANSRFVHSDGTLDNGDRFNIRLQVIVYKKAITKSFGQAVTLDLNGANGSNDSLSTPPGF